MADLKLQAILSLKDKMSGQMDKSTGALGRFSKAAGIAAIAIGGVAVGVGVKAIKAAAEFEKAMGNVATLVDTDKESMGDMSQAVLEMAKRTPKPISELAESLYDVRSAGIDADDAMAVLESSAKLATAGLSDTKSATNILTSAINVYGDETHNSNVLSDILFKTVKAGKTTVEELAQGFGKTAGIAKETGVGIEDLQASVAILTTGGLSASESYTALKAGISNILKPTADAKDAAQKLGINFDLATLQSEGLAGMLEMVTTSAGDDKQAVADLFGSVEAANAIFALTSEDGLAKMKQIQEDMLDPANQLEDAYAKQKETAAAQYDLLKNNLNVELINLGNKILPWLIEAMKLVPYIFEVWGDWFDTITDKISNVIVWFWDLVDDIKAAWDSVSGIFEKITSPSKSLWEGATGWIGGLFKQFGGGVSRGQPYMVGEAGPELFVPNQGGTIVPNGRMGTEVTINFNNPVVRSNSDLERIILEVKRSLNRDLQIEQIGV